MSGPSPDSFKRALDKFKQSVSRTSPELLGAFEISNLDDVRDCCLSIQREMGSESNLRGMKRLRPFIEAMDQLGQTIDVFVNASELVCFIWGPIKFLLGVAKNYTDTFDKLLDVYEQVGRAIPGLKIYQSAFEQHETLRGVLEDYYADILRFHAAAIRVFRRPKWKTVFKSAWKTFETEFQPLIQCLQRRKELLESEKLSASLYQISNTRDEVKSWREEYQHNLVSERLEKHKQRLHHVKQVLQAASYEEDQEQAIEIRSGNSGAWILTDSTYQKWASKTKPRHDVLYVSGIPGAGKTTIAAFIIDELLRDNSSSKAQDNTLVAYFYCKHKQENKHTHNGLLRALLEQVVTKDPVVSEELFDELTKLDSTTVRSNKALEPLLEAGLGSYHKAFLIIDGLDEAANSESAKSLDWLLSLVNQTSNMNQTAVRLLISGQRDGQLDSILSPKYSSIHLELSTEHDLDIRRYCATISSQMRTKFGKAITDELEQNMIRLVTGQSCGMFLYARLVMENLLLQTTVARLHHELEPGTFPDGLERAYERVSARVFAEGSKAEREDSRKIIGWLVCAERMLYWREIQALFCIDLQAGTSDWEANRLRVSCKDLCGSLVDVHQLPGGQIEPDSRVQIVHSTAREYLIRTQVVNITLEHARAANFCFRYLTSPPFHDVFDPPTLEESIKQGYYSFQDYAVQHCLNHLDKSAAWTLLEDNAEYLATMNSAKDFLRSYGVLENHQGAERQISNEDFIRLGTDYRANKVQPGTQLNIERRTSNIRRHIESLNRQTLSPEDFDAVQNLYGPRAIFKCPRIKCVSFFVGFDVEKDRTRHIGRHDRPFCCPEADCFASELGFERLERLEQHRRDHHSAVENTQVEFPKPVSLTSNSLRRACKSGNTVAISAILDGEPELELGSIKAKDNLLYLAAKGGHFEACKLLLERKAPIYSESAERRIIERDQDRCAHTNFPSIDVALSYGRHDICSILLPVAQKEFPQEALERFYSNRSFALSTWTDYLLRPHRTGGELESLKMLIVTDPDSHEFFKKHAFTESYTSNLSSHEKLTILKFILQYRSTEWVTPDMLFKAESSGHKEVVSLLEPILNLPHYSRARVEAILKWYNVLPTSFGRDDQLAALQRQSPAIQHHIIRQHKKQALQNEQERQFSANNHGSGLHVLQDYKTQLLLVEQRNMKRLMIARQVRDESKDTQS